MAWVGGWGCARACVCVCVCWGGGMPYSHALLLARVFRLQSLFGKPADLLEKDSDQNDTCKTPMCKHLRYLLRFAGLAVPMPG